MQPQFVTKPAFTIVGMKLRSTAGSPEFGKHWERFDPRSGEIQHLKNPHVYYGASDNYDHESREFDYLAAREVERAEDIPDGMEAWTIPEQHYAVFTTTLPKIGETMGYIDGQWLPSSGYDRTAGPDFEYYGEGFDPQNPDSEFQIYVPVSKK